MSNPVNAAPAAAPRAAEEAYSSAFDSFLSQPTSPEQMTSDAKQAPQAQPQAESSVSDSSEETSVAAPKYLEVPVTDERGRRMVKVDLSDEASLKKVVARAHQAQQLLSRVNKAEDTLKKLQTERDELSTNFKKLNDIFEQHGEEGLIDMLRGKKGAFKDWEEQRFARRKFMETASDEERRAAELEERLAQIENQRSIELKRQEAKDKEYAEREETQLTQDLVNRFTPVFNKYRFEGKLDAAVAEVLDEKIWNNAMSELEKLDENQINQASIDRAFRASYVKFQSLMQNKAKTDVKKQVEATKKAAGQSVQAAVKGARTQAPSNNAQIADKAKNTGNWSDLFMDALRKK